MSNEKIESQNLTEMHPALVPDERFVNIVLETADGGALLRMSGGGKTKSRVVEGDKDSDSFKRKVQRTLVRWVKSEFFTAPPRRKNEPASA